MNHEKVLKLTQHAMFLALIFILGLTPLGYIYLPIAAITTVHIPVIVGACLLGPKSGAVFGMAFGLTSLIRAFSSADATSAVVLGTGAGGSFGPYNLLLIVCILFIPRILVGVFSGLLFKGMQKICKSESISLGVTGFVGSMTNTVFFLGGMYVFAFDRAAVAFGLSEYTALSFLKVLMGIVSFNGVLEAIAAVILTVALGKVLLHLPGVSRSHKA